MHRHWTLLLAALPALAQPQPATPAFEVATVKSVPRPSTEDMLSGKARPGRTIDASQATFRYITLQALILAAYDLKAYQLSAPPWANDTQTMYEVVAKLPEGAKPEQVPAMLQTLLKDRFQLTAHREKKELAFYALVVAKTGAKLKEVPASTPASFKGGAFENGVSHIHTVSNLSTLAFAIAPYMDRPVLDLTGLTAIYDMDLAVTRDPSPGPSPLPLLDFQSAVEQLGLKLEPRKEPIDTLVVDHAERVPTEN